MLEQWDLILFDAPPALAAGDALAIASKADGGRGGPMRDKMNAVC